MAHGDRRIVGGSGGVRGCGWTRDVAGAGRVGGGLQRHADVYDRPGRPAAMHRGVVYDGCTAELDLEPSRRDSNAPVSQSGLLDRHGSHRVVLGDVVWRDNRSPAVYGSGRDLYPDGKREL